MVIPLLKEMIVRLENPKTFKLSFPLERVVRIVDKKGATLGLVLDRRTLEELEEELESLSPEFWKEIELSRKSGRVSSKEIERRLGIK